MKKKWTNNLAIKILSLILGAIIWIVIINIEDPVKTETYHDIEVTVLNEDVITDKNLVYTITEGDTVDVTVRGNKSVVDSLKREDIIVTADMKDLSMTYSISLNYDCPKLTAAGGTLELGSVKNMKIELENTKEESFPIRYNLIGEVEDGYYVSVDQCSSKPSVITVKAAQSVFDQIKTVRVDVDVTGREGAFVVQTTPKAYDENDDLIESPNLSFSTNNIKVSVNVLPTKSVYVNVSREGTPADGYQYVSGSFEPKTITVAGEHSRLAALKTIDIKVDITGAKADLDQEIALSDYLPEGIIIADENVTLAMKIVIEKEETKKITFSVSDIDVQNVPTDMLYNFENENATFHATVSALSDVIDDIDVNAIHPYIDLSDKSNGKYNITIQFDKAYTVSLDTNKVSVILSDSNGPEPTIHPTSTPHPTIEPTPTATEPAGGTPGEGDTNESGDQSESNQEDE